MQQQKLHYFEQLVQEQSPRARDLSYTISHSQISKVAEGHTYLISPKSPTKSIKNIISNKPQLDMQRIEELSKARQNNKSPQKSEDELIKQYQDEIEQLRKKRVHLEGIKPDPSNVLKNMKVSKQVTEAVRKQQDLRRQIEYQKSLKQRRVETEARQVEGRTKKREEIESRMKKLQKHKQQRKDVLSSKSLPSLPKYKLMEKMFIMEELKWELDKKVQSKRLHEIRYRDYMKHDHNAEKQKGKKELKRIKTEVESQRKIDERELQERRKQMIFLLEEKRRHKSVKVNPESSHKFEIAKDRAQNPQKYHFLKLKNLTDQQIFKDFRDFQPLYDNKLLGNKYLQQSKAVLKKQQVSSENPRSKSNSNLGKSDRMSQKARNNESFKSQRMRQGHKEKEQMLKILRGSESKSKVLQLLSKESQNSSRSIVELEGKLAKNHEYQQLIKIQNSIDSQYLQFLKAKIVALGLKLH